MLVIVYEIEYYTPCMESPNKKENIFSLY